MGKDQELLEAARLGNFGVVEKLIFPKSKSSSLAASLGIRVGAYINCQDQAGYTPLHHASLNGHSTIVKILLDAGADVNVSDVKGSCPLHLAAWNGKAEIVRLLLTTGPNFASINEQNGDKETALHCASQHGHAQAVRILLENHSDPELRNIRDESALDLASQYGRLDVVRTLLSFHPKILVRSPERFTPLHLASRNGHRGVVELLLAHGADIDKVGANGTALHEAALFGKYEVVSLLLKRGAETSSKDSSRRTALQLVSQLDTQISREIGKLIVARIQDGDDYEPLPSIMLSTPKKPKQLKKDVKRMKKLGESTSMSASTSSLSRNFSRSFGEADLAYRDSMRGRPQMAASFRLSQASHMSPESSQSPTRSRIKTGLLRRTSSARSARSLPRLASSSSFHGNRSLHSFSTQRKKSDAMSLQDWSVRQHHPSIDMFPVNNPTRGSQSGRKTSVSEPSSPQMAPAFITPIHTPESPGSPNHDSSKTDNDNVFLPGDSSRHPSFESSSSIIGRPAPKAIIPLKPPAEDSTHNAPQISQLEAPLKVIGVTGPNSSAAQDVPQLTTTSSSGGFNPGSVQTNASKFERDHSTVTAERENSDSVDGGSQIRRSSSNNTLTAGSSGQHLSSSSDLKSPGAPKKPHRKKPSKPPPLPPKPAHMAKVRPPSPTNPPPEDEMYSDSDDEGTHEPTAETDPTETLEFHEPGSPLYGNISYDNPIAVTSQEIIQAEQSENHDNAQAAKEQTFDQSEFSHKNFNYASITKLETSPLDDDNESQTIETHADQRKLFKPDNGVRPTVQSGDSMQSEIHSKKPEFGPSPNSSGTPNQGDRSSAKQSESSKNEAKNASPTQSGRFQDRRSFLQSNINQKSIKSDAAQKEQSSKSSQESASKNESTSQSTQGSNSTRIAPKPSFRHIRPHDQSHSKMQNPAANKTQSTVTQGLKSDHKSKAAAMFPPQPVKEQVSRIATITHLKSTTELKMSMQSAPPKLPEKKSKEKAVARTAPAGTVNTNLVAPLPAPRTSRRKSNHSDNPPSRSSQRRPSDVSIPLSSSKIPSVAQSPIEIKDYLRPQPKVVASTAEATDSVLEPQRKSSKFQTKSLSKDEEVVAFPGSDPKPVASCVEATNWIETAKMPDASLSHAATSSEKSTPDPTEKNTLAFLIALNKANKGHGSKDRQSLINSNAVVPNPDEANLPEASPSPPFSPPSPKTAMLEVSSTLQKIVNHNQMIPTSSTDETMHIFSNSSNLQSTELLKNIKSQKPDIPPKKLSIRQQINDKKQYFIKNDDINSKSLPKMQSEKKTKPKSRFNFSQKLASFATFPPRSENSASGKSTERKKLFSGVKGHFKPQVNKMKKSSKLLERSESARNSGASSGENSPITNRSIKRPDVTNPAENIRNSSKATETTAKSNIVRPKSGLTYTSSQVKRARICSTKSVTDIPTAPSYGEYDNLETVRSKRASSLGPQVPTPLPKKSSNTESKDDSMQSPAKSHLLTKSMNHDHHQTPPSNIPAPIQSSRLTGREIIPSNNDATRSRPPVRRKSLNHDRSWQKDNTSNRSSAVNRAMSFQGPFESDRRLYGRKNSAVKITSFEQGGESPARRNTSPATVLSQIPIKSKRSSSLNQNVTSQSSASPQLNHRGRDAALTESPQLQDTPRIARPRSLTSSPRPAPRIKPPLVKTPPTAMRNLQRPKKPIKPSSLLKPGLSFDKESPVKPKTEIGSPGTDSSSIAARSLSSLDPTEDWSDALSDRTDDVTLPREVKKYRGLIRGSSLSYRSRFCGSRDAYESDEFDYDYHFEPPYSRVKSSQHISERKSAKKAQRTSSKTSRPSDLGHFPVTGEFMEVDSSPSSFKTNLGEPGQKRRKGDKTSQLNDTLETVISQEDRLYSRNSAYDNNNVIIDEQTAAKRSSKKSSKMTTAPASPMSDGLPDFGAIVDTVTAVRNKTSPHGSTSGVSSSSSSQSSTLAKQEPSSQNDTDEWAQIANVMKSVGSSLNKGAVYAQEFEETFWKIMTGSELPRKVATWLSDLNLSQYEEVLVGNGFDNISFLASNILEEQDLIDMNIQNTSHRRRLLDSAKNLPKIKTLASYSESSGGTPAPSSVREWLLSIALEEYEDLFNRMGFMTLEKASRMKDTEIQAIIPLLGHRKRIRASLGPMKLPKSRTTSQSSSKIKIKTSPPLPRSPLLDTVNFFKDYSQSVSGAKASTNTTLNAYGTASSSSSALTNYSSLSDQVVPVSISEEPELEGTKNDILISNPQKTVEKTSDFDEIFNLSKQEDDLLTLAINRLTDNTKDKDSNDMSATDTEDIRVPNARRASYLSSNGDLVLRPPNETTEEGVNISSWCHDPEVLIKSCCNYQAYYLGSMLVRDVKGVESTVEACAKMKKSTDSMKKIPTVTLSISYKGVKFIDSKSKHEIAEHEIHNISFASQDADDLSTLAYITRDARTDHHYCHVFRVVTLDVAYEIILTLGQAFEIAYQLILKEKALKGGS